MINNLFYIVSASSFALIIMLLLIIFSISSLKKRKKIFDKISKNRKDLATNLSKQIVEVLKELGMPHAQFNIALEELTEFKSNGRNSIRFLFSANKGSQPQDLTRVASGGELSRLILAIKYVSSRIENVNNFNSKFSIDFPRSENVFDLPRFFRYEFLRLFERDFF